ncbi:MAG: alpha/beta hydrolase [Gammaproteobacteria bacterium]|nr:alpha/beta hydrolase [Gammaproteobacteria bacterium]MDH5694826.1 alpha/beta hydrolase [Gammaproteobacteria bacterium]
MVDKLPCRTFELKPFTVNYAETGSGDTLLFLHCSSGNYREWLPQITVFREHYHILAPDLLGYGKTSPWPKVLPDDVPTDGKLLEHLLTLATGQVHIIGHSFGGAVALEAVRNLVAQKSNPVTSMMLIEPVAFHILKENNEKEAKRIDAIARCCIRHLHNGNLEKAAAVYMGYWLGKMKWMFAPKKFRAGVVRSIAKVAHEFGSIPNYTAMAEDYRSINIPVTLVQGNKTTNAAKAMNQILMNKLPNSQSLTLPGAGHLSPYTHPKEITSALEKHLAFSSRSGMTSI